jgi:hypothetical protein
VAFNLSPSDYLKMLLEQHAEYIADPLSARKAIAVSMFANHISEHVFAAYPADVSKIGNSTSSGSYRLALEKQNPDLVLIRDLFDYGKHGPTLRRKSVQVTNAGIKEALVPQYTGLLLALTNHNAEDKLVVTLGDGKELLFQDLIAKVVRFWSELFAEKRL